MPDGTMPPLKFDHTRRQVGDGHCDEMAGAASKIC